ncbi:ACT domain-containing protein [Jiulongibacter sp. NS-SX5]|uniref:ACT domain-containing protein n=1 Tax=Jiulongibacter sp. NS-SX5 TaxID=3463854 RepID=UPI0040588242
MADHKLQQILKNLTPRLIDGEFVFVSLPKPDPNLIAEAKVLVKEDEGITLVLPIQMATENDLKFGSSMALITLDIETSLDLVGLTAVFSKALTEAGISCNVVAGFYHDHIFVPHEKKEVAIGTLKSLSSQS